MRTSLVAEALSIALCRRQPAGGVTFHADHGTQYTSGIFADFLFVQTHRSPGRTAPPTAGANIRAEAWLSWGPLRVTTPILTTPRLSHLIEEFAVCTAARTNHHAGDHPR